MSRVVQGRLFELVSQWYPKSFLGALEQGLSIANKRLSLPHTPDFVPVTNENFRCIVYLRGVAHDCISIRNVEGCGNQTLKRLCV